MPALMDLTGQTFGRLTVVSRAENGSNGHARWNCRCVCGNETVTGGSHMRSGHSASCGCLQVERASDANTKPDDEIGYYAAHVRISRTRGPASGWMCVDCCGRAADWSLRHDAPVIYFGETVQGDFCAFSPDPNSYDPRCRTCHAAYDKAD